MMNVSYNNAKALAVETGLSMVVHGFLPTSGHIGLTRIGSVLANLPAITSLDPLVGGTARGSQSVVQLLHKVRWPAIASRKDLGREDGHRDLGQGSTVETPISGFVE